jgi:hypothetical protein
MFRQTNWKKTMSWMWAMVLVFTVLGCGGGGSSSGQPSEPTPISSANGIWHGTFTEPPYGTFDLSVLTHDGEIMGISNDAGVIYHGYYTLDQSALSGAVKVFEIGGGLFATAEIAGTYSGQGTIDAQASNLYLGTGERTTSSIHLVFDELYNRPSALSLVEGTWFYSEPGYSVTMNVDSFGDISGSDSEGCEFSGKISLLDTDHNLYAVDVDVTQCGAMNGFYGGLATLSDENTLNDTFSYCLIGDQYILLNYLSRR